MVDGETGFLVPLNDAQALAEAIMKLLENPGLAGDFGRQGRERARALFDENLVLQRQLTVYHALIQKKIWKGTRDK